MDVRVCLGMVCALCGIAVYSNTLQADFAFDDEAALQTNPDLTPNVSWKNLLRNDFWGNPISNSDSHKSYRPLCVASFRLNYMLHGLDPMGYHLVNVLLHAMVCYLYVQLCALVFTAVWPALLAGLLFAVHPIHTEAVAGLVGRADVLAGMFLLNALLAYRQSWLVHRKWWVWFSIALFSCLCSALCKEIAITSTVVCVVYDYSTHNKDCLFSLTLLRQLLKGNPPSWFSHFLIRVAVVSTCTLTFLILRIQLNQGSPIFSIDNNPAQTFATPYRQLHWAYLIFFNIKLLLFPSALCAEYAMNTIPPVVAILDHRHLLTLCSFSGLCWLGWIAASTTRATLRRPLILGLSLMVFPFLPASNLFFPVGFVVAERVLYLPSMGFCMLVALGLWKSYRLYPRIIKVGLVYLLLVHSVKTLVRNKDWYSSKSLFQSAVITYPNNGKLFSNLGTHVDKDGNKSLAIQLFQHSIKLEPHFIAAYSNLGYSLREQGKMAAALKVYQGAADLVTRGLSGENIHVATKNLRVYNSLSNMLREEAGDGEGALHYAMAAIQQEPEWENGYHSKAKALVYLGRLEQAKPAFEKALHINPNFASAHSNYGNCLERLQLLTEAESSYRQAVRLDPSDVLSKFRLAALISKLETSTPERLLEAVPLLKDVLEADPANGNATLNLGNVYLDLNRKVEAEKLFKHALTLAPKDKGVLYNLGVILTGDGRYEEAIEYLAALVLEYPDHVRGRSQLGTSYMQSNKSALAVLNFDLVLEQDPDDLTTLHNYGLLCIREQKLEKAIQLLSHLLQLQPENSAVREQIKHLQKKIGKH